MRRGHGSLVLLLVLSILTIVFVAGRGDRLSHGWAAVRSQAGVSDAAAVGEAVAWKMPLPAKPYNEREGAVLFHHYCATCHGNEGQGDGLNAYNLDPKPRDLSDPAFQKNRSDEDLASVIRSGGGVAGLSTGMPPWGRTLTERKIRNVVSFLRTLEASAP